MQEPYKDTSTDNLIAAIEAILFIAGDAVAEHKLAELLDISLDELAELVLQLQTELSSQHRGLSLIKNSGGYRLCTKAALSPYLDKFTQVYDKQLSQPLMETLSIIAFKQPVTKQEIEEIRGVNSDKMIRRLLERDLIQEVGRKHVIGRPILYGTTNLFLQCFGLNDLKDLPELPHTSYADREQIYRDSNLFENFELDSLQQETNEQNSIASIQPQIYRQTTISANEKPSSTKLELDPIEIALSSAKLYDDGAPELPASSDKEFTD